MTQAHDKDERYRALAFEQTVIFPGTKSEVFLEDPAAARIAAWRDAGTTHVVALTSLDPEAETHDEDSFYPVGTLLAIDAVTPSSDGQVLRFTAERKVRVRGVEVGDDGLTTQVTFQTDVDDWDPETKTEILVSIKKLLRAMGKRFRGSGPYINAIEQLDSVRGIIALVMPIMRSPVADKQRLLAQISRQRTGRMFVELLRDQKRRLDLQVEMSNKLSEKANRSQREAMLREQLKVIQDELSEASGGGKGDKKDYRKRIEEADMPDEVRDVALEQAERLESLGSGNLEAAMVQNYLDLLVALPWASGEAPEIDLKLAREVLDREHHGIDKVKTRIIQHLAVMKLKGHHKGSILLLVGPPGTGKTSLGRSIAEAMQREYVRISLGGVRDEAEIRGHRRTYVGALPGRIIQGMKKAGTKNPVFVLDEVDKMMAGFSGDPSAALLEVLDPEQNNSFADHYLELPYDLSEVVFVATANTTSRIPAALLDRLEVIELSGYTTREKRTIATRHLWRAVLEDHGLSDDQLLLHGDALETIIAEYTREAGVRGLKKQLATIARGVSETIVNGDADLPLTVEDDMLRDLLGKPRIRLDKVLRDPGPGVVTGLAWTPVGGDILFIEASMMPGKGQLILTGQLGDVMKESATISRSLIRSRLAQSIQHVDLSDIDLHIHVPSGAIPKDGPSAGITLFSAMASLVLGQSVDPELAMTGEITLRGQVLPVGGIKEKVLAAHRAGIKRVLMSWENEVDLDDVPAEVRDELEFVLVETIEEVVSHALEIDLLEPLRLPLGDPQVGAVSPST